MTGGVSVIVPAYNAAAFLRPALESALAQTAGDVEVIVVNDGSRDETAAVARSFDSAIRYVEQANAGPARARNVGAALATRDLIAFLDADDLWVETKLEEQIACLHANPDAGLTYSQMVNFSDTDGSTAAPYPPQVHSGWLFDRLLTENFIPLPSVVMPTRVFRDVGGFDESLRTAEDTNLYLRIALRRPFAGLARPLVRRRLHGANISATHSDVPKGTLKNLDLIVAQHPGKAPDRYPPMKEAYRVRGRLLQSECFEASRYTEAAAVSARFAELGIDDREVALVGRLSRLPRPLATGGRQLLRLARRASRVLRGR